MKSVAVTWLEIIERKEEFQRILNLLIDFDERTGRYKRTDPHNHYLRKACAVAPLECLRIFVQRLDESVYQVVLRLDAPGGHEVTGYVHEDGINQECRTAAKDHPVNGITCLTDLLAGAASVSAELQPDCLGEFLSGFPAGGAK